MIIIAGQAGAGKTTLANIIAKKSFELGFIPKIMSFAGALKDLAMSKGFDKENHPEEYRIFCQDYGKEKRDANPNHWVQKFEIEVHKLLMEEQKDLKESKKYWERCIIVDDCRYTNEIQVGLKRDATLLFISYGDRESVYKDRDWTGHESEELANAVNKNPAEFNDVFNYFIENNGTEEDLKKKVMPYISEWCGLTTERSKDNFKKLSECVSELIDLLLLSHLEEEEEEDDDEHLTS